MSTELEKTTGNRGLENVALKNLKWPTSRPGPQATQPPPGQILLPTRTDQVVEIDYDQERGMPGVQSPLRSLPDPSLKENVSPDLQASM